MTALAPEQMRGLTEGQVPPDVGSHIADLRAALRYVLDCTNAAPHANECDSLWSDEIAHCTCWKNQFDTKVARKESE